MHAEMDIFHVNLAPRQILPRLHISPLLLKRTHNSPNEKCEVNLHFYRSFRSILEWRAQWLATRCVFGEGEVKAPPDTDRTHTA